MFRGIRYLFRLVYRLEKKYIISLSLLEIVNALTSVIYVIFPKYILDALFTKEIMVQRAIFYLILFVVVILITNTLTGLLKYWSEKSRDQLYTRYSLMQGKQFLSIEYAKLENPDFINLRDQSTKYMNAYGFAGIIPLTTMMIGKALTAVSLLSIIAFLDIRICIIYLVMVLINTMVTLHNRKKINKNDIDMVEAERRRDYIKQLFEDKQCAKEIRVYTFQNWLLHKFQVESDTVNSYKKKQNSYQMRNGLIRILVDFIQQAGAYFYLIYCSVTGMISVGSFTMYLSGIHIFCTAVLDMIQTFINLKQYNQYFEPFQQFNTYLNEMNQGTKSIKKEEVQTIEFHNVSFRYSGQTEYAIRNLNLTIHKNEAICIVGENGAGKSTVIKLLLRLYPVSEGEITLNGVNIQEYLYEDYMNCFSTLFQDYKLFAFSLKQNIILNHKEDKRLDECLELSGVQKMLENKNRNLDVSVFKLFDEKGIEFSGGESQKIAFARTLYKEASILLLDEPSSALDPISEANLLDQFAKISKNKLAIFISHRLTSAKICSRILVFHQGQLLEDGDHETLMKMNGQYAELYRIQSSLYTS